MTLTPPSHLAPGRLRHRLVVFVLFLCCWLFAGAGSAVPAIPGERVDYRVFYRGFLSVGKKLEMANATLRTRTHRTKQGELYESNFWLTTEQHGFVDSLYPFRYRLRSFYRSPAQGTLFYSVFQKNKEKSQLQLYQVDPAQLHLTRYRQVEKTPANPTPPPAELLALLAEPGIFEREKVFEPKGKPPLVDLVCLLQAIRGKDLAKERQFRIVATDGGKAYAYAVTVEGEESIGLNDRTWETWRLGVTEEKLEEKERKGAKTAFQLWITRDAQRLPVRAEVKHKTGQFFMELSGQARELGAWPD